MSLCPNCAQEQLCPCESCATRNAGKTVWRWQDDGERIACGHCGHCMHVDAWLAFDYSQMKKHLADVERRFAVGESA